MDPTTPPNTTPFMIAGYVVLVGGILLYIASLIIRYKQAITDWLFLDELERSK